MGPIELNHEPATPATPPARFGTLAFDAKLDGALLGTARARSPAPLRGAVRLAVRGRATPDGATLETLPRDRDGASAIETLTLDELGLDARALAHRRRLLGRADTDVGRGALMIATADDLVARLVADGMLR